MAGQQNRLPFRARPRSIHEEHRIDLDDEWGYGKDRIEEEARRMQDEDDRAFYSPEYR